MKDVSLEKQPNLRLEDIKKKGKVIAGAFYDNLVDFVNTLYSSEVSKFVTFLSGSIFLSPTTKRKVIKKFIGQKSSKRSDSQDRKMCYKVYWFFLTHICNVRIETGVFAA